MFRFIILVASSLSLAAAIQFTDCATDRSNTALTVHQLDFSPSPVTFPGDLHVTLNLTINRPISLLFVDVVLEKNTLGIWSKVPCVSNIGTCDNIDACTIMDRILNGSSLVSQDLGQQVDAMLLSALGHKAHCPIQPENLFINDYTIKLQAIPGALSLISTGKYRVKISVKDDPTNPDNLGCMQFQANIGVPTPGVG
ncbi:ganglioside GM2 activator-like [Mercenaria mercenaria]|uniref:ganglioside GM2 activator-like n=1 Tax=Mercenaria mercenaria TaxID=6596 RepID=UPI00234F3496|nr:ganglioside GM2 activator-like [Mercenaria mercenaria]